MAHRNICNLLKAEFQDNPSMLPENSRIFYLDQIKDRRLDMDDFLIPADENNNKINDEHDDESGYVEVMDIDEFESITDVEDNRASSSNMYEPGVCKHR
jgi:hypothetical protein